MGQGRVEGLDSTTLLSGAAQKINRTHREVYLAAAHDVIQEGILLHHLKTNVKEEEEEEEATLLIPHWKKFA